MSRLGSKIIRGVAAFGTLAVMLVSANRISVADDQSPKPAASAQPQLFDLGGRILSMIKERESVQMLTAVLNGSQMGPGDGWFHPSLMRYDWKWLAERHHIASTGEIPADRFLGDKESFERLDRNRDGAIKADDFDWSGDSPYVRQMSQSGQWFRGIDGSSNGRLSREEWEQFFQRVAGKKDFVTPDDLRAALFPPPPKGPAGQGPSQETLLQGLIAGELGSLAEGPALNAMAPNFRLKTHDGTRSIQLSTFRHKKPVVLIFGSFT
jgi:hypothetical protein